MAVIPLFPNRAEEQAHFWRPHDLHDLEVLHAHYVTHSFMPHTHDGFVVAVIERGAERFRYRGAEHTASAHSIVVINPGEVHTGQAAHEHGWAYRVLYPEVHWLQRAAAELTGRAQDVPFFAQSVYHDPELAGLLLRMHAALEAPVSTLERESRLLWSLGHLVARYADTRPPVPAARPAPGHVRQVRDYLEAHYAEAITLDQLASLVNLSPFYVLRIFRGEVGLPPHAYLTNVRVRQARRLLQQGYPVASVAAQTGFVDQSHLTRHFKRVVGVPPGQYRQMCKNIQDRGHG